jgi:hypothetical protein
VSPVLVGEDVHKFLRLAVDSRLKITTVGKPRDFRHPIIRFIDISCQRVYVFAFEVEVRIIRRFLAPGDIYEGLDIGRIDSLPPVLGRTGRSYLLPGDDCLKGVSGKRTYRKMRDHISTIRLVCHRSVNSVRFEREQRQCLVSPTRSWLKITLKGAFCKSFIERQVDPEWRCGHDRRRLLTGMGTSGVVLCPGITDLVEVALENVGRRNCLCVGRREMETLRILSGYWGELAWKLYTLVNG